MIMIQYMVKILPHHLIRHILLRCIWKNPQSFGGDGDIVGKFGIDLRDKATFRIATRTFEREVTKRDSTIVRPREGDLIYFVLSDRSI